jgi:hypothetical protein
MGIPLEGYYISKVQTPGKFARYNPINFVKSFAASASGILFGRAVQITAADADVVQIPSASGLVFPGVAMESVDTHNTDVATETYLAGAAVGVASQGNVIVFCEEAVAVGDAVRFRIVANGANVPGSFGKTADAGKTMLLSSACARWETASASGIGETGLMAELFLAAPFTVTAD